MEYLAHIAGIARDISAVLALIALLIKPARDWIFGLSQIREGLKCQLRGDIVKIYYKNLDAKEIREYEYNTMEANYKAYKALGGNSFIKKLHEEMQKWTIVQ